MLDSFDLSLTLSFFCVCPFLLVRQSEAEVRRVFFSCFIGTMWLLHSFLTLLALSAGLCAALTSEQGEFPLPSLDLFLHVGSEKTLVCCNRWNNFSGSTNSHKLDLMSVSVFHWLLFFILKWNKVSWCCLSLYFWNLEKLSRLKLNLVASPFVQCLHVGAGWLAQNTAQRPLSRLWRCCFLSNLDLRVLTGLMAQHLLTSATVNLVKMDFAEHGCHRTLRAVNKKVGVQMMNLGSP